MHDLNEDVIKACADLVGRAGASGFEIGYVHDDVPVEDASWYAYASYRGARLTAQDHRSPSAAALALAERLLSGATCRCRRPVSLSEAAPGCHWRLREARWEPSCDVEPVRIDAARGDLSAMQAALRQPLNRRDRRRAKKRR